MFGLFGRKQPAPGGSGAIADIIKANEWSVARGMAENRLQILRFRQPVPEPSACKTHPQLLSIVWTYGGEDTAGLPDEQLQEDMAQLEDSLVAAVEADALAILTAVVTFDGSRQWLFYTQDTDGFLGRMQGLPPYQGGPYPIELSSEHDPGWTFLRETVLGDLAEG